LSQAALDQKQVAECDKWLAVSKNPTLAKFDFDGRHKMYVKVRRASDGELRLLMAHPFF
jgi:hypothetical protein